MTSNEMVISREDAVLDTVRGIFHDLNHEHEDTGLCDDLFGDLPDVGVIEEGEYIDD